VVPQRAQSTEPLNPLVCGAKIIQIYARMQMLCIKKCTREVKKGRGEWENSRLTWV
jgi:hypothetical protein